jgi:hypothetical protein
MKFHEEFGELKGTSMKDIEWSSIGWDPELIFLGRS